MKALVGAFNQEKALEGDFSVIVKSSPVETLEDKSGELSNAFMTFTLLNIGVTFHLEDFIRKVTALNC